MNRSKAAFTVALVAICTIGQVYGMSPSDNRKTIVIDPGHSPSRPGAMGIQYNEQIYNDRLSMYTAKRLANAGKYRVIMTRTPNSDQKSIPGKRPGYLSHLVTEKSWEKPYVRDLYSRPHKANMAQADLLISIHHDSVQPSYLVNGLQAATQNQRDTTSEFKDKFKTGFSIFISTSNTSTYEQSLRFARLLSFELRISGRRPSNYHSELRIDGKEGYKAIDEASGIYANNLAVLKAAKMPSILVEAGVIVDQEDESIVSSGAYPYFFSGALEVAISRFFETYTN